MRSLLEVQRDLGAAILRREPERAWGVAAYRNNVFGNWAQALASVYPVVRKILSAQSFDALAHQYAREHPSASGDLNEYGEQLPAFVAAHPDTQHLPYLPDVARMEWLAHLAYYAGDSKPFDPVALAGLPPKRCAGLRLRPAPGSALLESGWPLARLWEIHQDDYRGEQAVELSAGAYRVLIYRPRWRAQVVAVTLGEFHFLAGAARGDTLGETIGAALALDASFDPAAALPRWVQAGAIAL